jgi:hypothetical protein
MNKSAVIDALESLSDTVNRIEHDPIQSNGIDRAIALISNFPDDGQWVLMKERLPEDGDTVWVTAVYMGDAVVKESLYSDRCFLDQRGFMLNNIVTAWKPREIMLPYKEES